MKKNIDPAVVAALILGGIPVAPKKKRLTSAEQRDLNLARKRAKKGKKRNDS